MEYVQYIFDILIFIAFLANIYLFLRLRRSFKMSDVFHGLHIEELRAWTTDHDRKETTRDDSVLKCLSLLKDRTSTAEGRIKAVEAEVDMIIAVLREKNTPPDGAE